MTFGISYRGHQHPKVAVDGAFNNSQPATAAQNSSCTVGPGPLGPKQRAPKRWNPSVRRAATEQLPQPSNWQTNWKDCSDWLKWHYSITSVGVFLCMASAGKHDLCFTNFRRIDPVGLQSHGWCCNSSHEWYRWPGECFSTAHCSGWNICWNSASACIGVTRQARMFAVGTADSEKISKKFTNKMESSFVFMVFLCFFWGVVRWVSCKWQALLLWKWQCKVSRMGATGKRMLRLEAKKDGLTNLRLLGWNMAKNMTTTWYQYDIYIYIYIDCNIYITCYLFFRSKTLLRLVSRCHMSNCWQSPNMAFNGFRGSCQKFRDVSERCVFIILSCHVQVRRETWVYTPVIWKWKVQLIWENLGELLQNHWQAAWNNMCFCFLKLMASGWSNTTPVANCR